MKKLNLKKTKDHKKLKYLFITLLFLVSTFYTFNYLNKNIYNYKTKEYINLFTKISFSTKSNFNLILDKIFDIYDKFTRVEDFNYE